MCVYIYVCVYIPGKDCVNSFGARFLDVCVCACVCAPGKAASRVVESAEVVMRVFMDVCVCVCEGLCVKCLCMCVYVCVCVCV